MSEFTLVIYILCVKNVQTSVYVLCDGVGVMVMYTQMDFGNRGKQKMFIQRDI